MDQHFVRKLAFAGTLKELAPDAPVPCTLATCAPVQRAEGGEILDCTDTGVDLSRAPLPLLISHDQTKLAIGVIDSIRADGLRVTGQARFSSSPEAQQIRADVLAGIHQSLSVGYAHLDTGTQDAGGNFVYRWQPQEVSIVSVPADPQAGFFRSKTHQTNTTMPVIQNTAAAAATPANTADEINQLCLRHGVEYLAPGLIRSGGGLDAAKNVILETVARLDRASGGHQNTTMQRNHTDERQVIVNTLVARMGGKPEGEIIRSADTVGLATRALELAGQRLGTSVSRSEIISRSLHTTSDFPVMLGTAVGRVLHGGYTDAPVVLKEIARLANLPDFREKSVIRLGSAPSLELVNEHGEFKSGTISETSNSWRLATYGRIVGLTRQAMVNDDLGGFSEMLRRFGQAAARREADELVSALLSPQLVDGRAVFDAPRNSQITDKLSQGGLGAAVKALRIQTDLDGGLMLQEPAWLLVPAALEMLARQLLAGFSPAKSGDVQPYALNLLVEPRLDAASTTGWYLVAGNQAALEYGYLDGNEGIQTMQREGFEIDGLEIKARLDFGCGWSAPTGWVKSTGTT